MLYVYDYNNLLFRTVDSVSVLADSVAVHYVFQEASCWVFNYVVRSHWQKNARAKAINRTKREECLKTVIISAVWIGSGKYTHTPTKCASLAFDSRSSWNFQRLYRWYNILCYCVVKLWVWISKSTVKLLLRFLLQPLLEFPTKTCMFTENT